MKKGYSGFTLVELIVVIVILTILSTIGFFYLQGYTSSARNSLRIDSISKLSTVLEKEKVTEKPLMGFALSGQEVTNANIAGSLAIVGTNYKAGKINYRAFNADSGTFNDPLSGDDFRIGVTTKNYGQYEISSILEENSTTQAKIIGTWDPRGNTFISGNGVTGKNYFEITDAKDTNYFNIGDSVAGVGIPANTSIADISSDGMTLALDATLTGSATQIQLAHQDTPGLISGYDDNSSIVVENGSVLPYPSGN